MHFMKRDGGYCRSLEADCKTRLPRKVTLKGEGAVRAMIKRLSPMSKI